MRSGLKLSRAGPALFPRVVAVVLVALLTRVDRGWGYPVYKDRIPNGGAVPHPCKPNYMWRGVGHVNPLGGGSKNIFGADFLRFGGTWNETLCRHDSDEDGLTNGQELGDPNCVWTQGDLPTRTTNITHPGVCDPWESAQCKLYNAWIDCEVGGFECPAMENDPEIRNITLRFPPTAVPNTETNYMCMTFDLPGDDVYDLVGGEAVIDNAQVMHHMLLFSCHDAENPPHIPTPVPCGMAESGCNDIMSGWTVGNTGHCPLEQAGFRFGRGLYTRVMLQTHWNNPELRGDYVDSSGLTVHYTRRLRPNSATTLVVGQRQLAIPPRQPTVEITGDCPSACSRMLFTRPVYITDALNHMHYMGKSQKIELFRQGRLVSTITNDQAYSYDSPVRVGYDPPIQVLPGDDIKVTCVYNSLNKNETVYYGDATSAEMCFGFLTVYPKEALPYTTACLSYGAESVCDRFANNNNGGAGEGEGGNENGGGGGDDGGDSSQRTPRPTGAPPTTSGGDDELIEGCNWKEFTNSSSEGFRNVGRSLMDSCEVFGSCPRQCYALVSRLARHPCLHGGAWERVKGELLKTHEGLMMTAWVTSCPLAFCPSCQRCSDQ